MKEVNNLVSSIKLYIRNIPYPERADEIMLDIVIYTF